MNKKEIIKALQKEGQSAWRMESKLPHVVYYFAILKSGKTFTFAVPKEKAENLSDVEQINTVLDWLVVPKKGLTLCEIKAEWAQENKSMGVNYIPFEDYLAANYTFNKI